ncbi:uncharacterized protein LOC143191197 [Rhynchophorus ferrugineus]|uniref:FLYWCH-type domain-containing protein n=1 Tax=Rhynchophorus ferrugineus TaxID=354439 RepID=A0A834IK72_RHYFE|nr:hypothetical protein GWI33_002756 [Rhynchophorus ferrugineus]KAF7282380.1 hypothetical protein GWI33_002756 [Rhynchophorus ferrugineus]
MLLKTIEHHENLSRFTTASSQCLNKKKPKVILGKICVNGYAYITSYFSGDPPKRYLRCRYASKLKCRGRAIQNCRTSQIICVSKHNHPPNDEEVISAEFLSKLKSSLGNNATLKEIYEQVALMYPEGASLKPFQSIRSSMTRWRARLNKMSSTY